MSAHEKVEMSPDSRNMCCHDAFPCQWGDLLQKTRVRLKLLRRQKADEVEGDKIKAEIIL